ncbi:MAG: aminopeptidase P family N-terminal domain-containing protein, partial [Pseudomonadota bacterium]|nr:aminopeptidase P family N-terminal domain-containing protein [Pseudomonadota bacterium]
MALHFSRDEFAARTTAARHALRRAGLDALLIFGQENHYYLTGFDTSGYVFFQCAVLTADDQPITLLTRLPDFEQAKRTSVIEDIRLWYDAEGVNPADNLKDILAEKGLAGGRVGIEINTYGLTPANYINVAQALEGWCDLVDGSGIIQALRIIKSPAELGYVRRAAAIADASLQAMIDAAGPGVFEGE